MRPCGWTGWSGWCRQKQDQFSEKSGFRAGTPCLPRSGVGGPATPRAVPSSSRSAGTGVVCFRHTCEVDMIMNSSRWCADVFREEHRRVLASVQNAADLDAARKALYHYVTERQYEIHFDEPEHSCFEMAVARDCARVLRSVLAGSSDARVGFSVAQGLWDLSRGIARPDLSRAFFAELSHLLHGLDGTPEGVGPDASTLGDISGREAALVRSRELDRIWEGIEEAMARYPSGLEPEAMKRRDQRRRRVQEALGATDQQWRDWRWQVRAIIEDPERLAAAVTLREHERAAVERAGGLRTALRHHALLRLPHGR